MVGLGRDRRGGGRGDAEYEKNTVEEVEVSGGGETWGAGTENTGRRGECDGTNNARGKGREGTRTRVKVRRLEVGRIRRIERRGNDVKRRTEKEGEIEEWGKEHK